MNKLVKANLGICMGTAILIAPFIYAISFVPDVCAAIRDPKFDDGECKSEGNKQTCCWYQKSYPGQFGRGDKYCQTCTYYHDANGEPYEKCTDPKKQAIKLPPGSPLLQDLPELQSTDNSTVLSNDDSDTKTRTDEKNDNETSGFNIPDKLQESGGPTIGNEFLKEDETKGDYNTSAKRPNTPSPVPIPYPDTNNSTTGMQIRAD